MSGFGFESGVKGQLVQVEVKSPLSSTLFLVEKRVGPTREFLKGVGLEATFSPHCVNKVMEDARLR